MFYAPRRFFLLLFVASACTLYVAHGQSTTERQYGNWLAAPHPEWPSYPGSKKHPHGHGLYRIHFDAHTGRATSVETVQSSRSNILDHDAITTFMRWRCKPGAYTKVTVPISWGE